MHAEPRGLQPGREYFYRFRANGEISPVGRTKTAPAGATSALAFAFASCQQYEHGYFTAYKHMAQDDLDLVIHLGDYIYEYDTNSYTATGGNARANSNHEIVNLADYRERHAQYKTDPDLQAAHAAFPWLVTFDDHEIDNNWASDTPEDGLPQDVYFRRREAAFQAYWEHMPLRKAAEAATPTASRSTSATRTATWPRFHVMDTRQFRSDQACGDGTAPAATTAPTRRARSSAPSRSSGSTTACQQSPAKWQILAQQVFMAERDATVGAGESFSMDAWDGYKVSRDKLLRLHRDPADREPGRDHGRRAPELGQRPAAPTSPTTRSQILGSEFVGTSISTTGDGGDDSNADAMTENPWIKYNSQRRGYVRVSLTQQTCARGLSDAALRQAPGRADLHPQVVRRRGRQPRPEGRLR